jgi:class 3 adenylate cyclase/tetratricopeptide (TPR) repeat protein
MPGVFFGSAEDCPAAARNGEKSESAPAAIVMPTKSLRNGIMPIPLFYLAQPRLPLLLSLRSADGGCEHISGGPQLACLFLDTTGSTGRYFRLESFTDPEETAVDVANWLRNLGLERYETSFRENDVRAEDLCHLTAEDLEGLGVTAIGHRRRLLVAIAALRPQESPSVIDPDRLLPDPPIDLVGELGTTAERRPLSVMFCDLIGSTALSSRLDPEDLREVIRTYQTCVATTVQQFDGFIARYVGDGVLIYFGWPEARETDAERAVRAGLAVAAAVAKLVGGESLHVRIGIATGLVVIGEPIGSDDSRQQTAVGETPNLAARLQGLAGADQVVIDAATRRQIGGLFECQDLGTVELKGLPMAVPAWHVLSENRTVGQFEALRSGVTPMVGRDEEMDLLLRRWAQAKAGNGRVVLISAEPGVGKSRLAEALAEQLNRADYLLSLIMYQCMFRFGRSEHRLALALSEQIEQIGASRNDARLQSIGHPTQGMIRYSLGEFVAARVLLQQGLDYADPAPRLPGGIDLNAGTLCCLAMVLAYLGYIDQARSRMDEASSEARRLGDALTLVHVLYFAASFDSLTRSPAVHIEEFLARSTEQDFPFYLGWALAIRGRSLVAVGQAQEGLALLTQGLAKLHPTGTVIGMPGLLTWLAEAYALLGQPEAAQNYLVEAVRIIEITDERFGEAELRYRMPGDLLKASGDQSGAERSYRQAIAVADRQSAKLFQLRASTSLARLLRDQGKPPEARDLLAPIYDWFTEGFDAPDLKEAKALLDELA